MIKTNGGDAMAEKISVYVDKELHKCFKSRSEFARQVPLGVYG